MKAVPLTTVLIVGLDHYDWLAVRQEAQPKDPLELERQPDNQTDAKAIKVLWNGRHIGYVPRHDNRILAPLMDAGLRFAGLYLSESAPPWQAKMALFYLPAKPEVG